MEWFNDGVVLRLQGLLHFLDCFYVDAAVGFGSALGGFHEVAVSLYDGVCLCEGWLCQVLVFKINSIADSCFPCGLYEDYMRAIVLV